MALFGAEKCIPTGLQHGTVTVKQGGRFYETTTFRTEGAYSDGRHPDAVCFVPDVREDLARRDFTINAMAYSAEEGLIDPFGGRDDLAAHLVRAVGSRNAALRRTRCASCGSTGSRPGSASPSTPPPVLLPGHWGRIWTASRRSASRRNCSSCWRPPGPEAIWNPPFWPLSCRSWNRKNSRNGLRNSAVPSIGSNQQRRNVPARLAALLCPLGEAGARKALRKLKCSNALTDEVTALVGAGLPGAFSRTRIGPFHRPPIACGNQGPDPSGRSLEKLPAPPTPR